MCARPGRVSEIEAPALLTAEHDLSHFSCGELVLDDWLRRRALPNLALGASRSYVICEGNTKRVIGYHALSMGQIVSRDVTAAMRRNMPAQIPAIVLGRLAIDQQWHGRGLGQALLADVVRRAQAASEHVSARLVLVHALTPAAETFYRHHGFVRLPVEAPVLALDLIKFGAAHGTSS
jgi:GNAT superfamily N-acetyltransferase